MPNDKDSNPTAVALKAYQAARGEREAEEAKQVQAEQAVERAKQAAEALRQRNLRGDAAVTSLALLTADAEVPRTEGLAANAARLVETAKVKEADALAAYLAEVTPERLSDAPKAETQAAVDEMSTTLTRIAKQIRDRNTVIREAVDAARAAGVVPGGRDEGRIMYAIDSMHPPRHTIRVDGVRYQEAVPERIILDVLVRAVESAGYRVVSSGHLEIRTRD